MAHERHHDFDEDEQDDDDLEELRAELSGLVADYFVHALGDLEVALDGLFPHFEMEALGLHAIDSREVRITDQLEHVAGALEKIVGLDLQLAHRAKGAGLRAPEGHPRTRERMN